LATSAVEVEGLTKSYDAVQAVRGISFEVAEGEVFALLGPNGAGKTTTVEIMEGFRRRDGGRISVLGFDPASGDKRLKEQMGIVLQTSGVDEYLTVAETVDMFRGYYPKPRARDEVIRLVGLEDKTGTRVTKLSGGQRRRLDVAIALAGDPRVLFLDEPTTGFDPAARRHAWDTIRDLRSLGKSILLTTHYIEEAQQLADRVAILRSGEIAGIGSPQELLSSHAGVEIRYRRNGDDVVIATEEPTRVLNELTAEALAKGEELEALEVHRRTLEDVYLDLTREEDR